MSNSPGPIRFFVIWAIRRQLQPHYTTLTVPETFWKPFILSNSPPCPSCFHPNVTCLKRIFLITLKVATFSLISHQNFLSTSPGFYLLVYCPSLPDRMNIRPARDLSLSHTVASPTPTALSSTEWIVLSKKPGQLEHQYII